MQLLNLETVMNIRQKSTRSIGLTAVVAVLGVFVSSAAMAALLTDPNDARNWQGATVGTFAALYYGSGCTDDRRRWWYGQVT